MCGSKLLRWVFPFITVIILVTQVEAARITYTVKDLGKDITPAAINNSGQVVGFLTVAAGQRHAFLYKNGVPMDLGTFNGTQSQANAINNLGHIVGSYTSNGEKHGFLLDHGQFVDLFTAAAMDNATGINNSDIIMGQTRDPNYGGFERVILYDNGLVTDLSLLGQDTIYPGHTTEAVGLNDLGQAILFQLMCGHWECEHTYLFSEGAFTRIFPAKATSINDHGQFTGSSLNPQPSPEIQGLEVNGFLYDQGEKATISDLGGHFTYPKSINNIRVIVGSAQRSQEYSYRAFIYSSGYMTDLNTLLPANSAWTLTEAADINDRGQIVGTGVLNGEAHAFLLCPSAQQVEIDIKPHDANNRVNLHPHMHLPVVVFGSSVFDASSIRPSSVKLTGETIGLKGRGDRYLYRIMDINGDGFKDFSVTIFIDQLAATPAAFSIQALTLEATTLTGKPIQGQNSVKQVRHGRWVKTVAPQ